MARKFFLKLLAEGCCFFCSQHPLPTPTPSGRDPVSDLSPGETAARPLIFSGREGIKGKVSPEDKLEKKPTREPQAEEKASWQVKPIIHSLKLPAPRCRESSMQGNLLFFEVLSPTHAASCGECADCPCSTGRISIFP